MIFSVLNKKRISIFLYLFFLVSSVIPKPAQAALPLVAAVPAVSAALAQVARVAAQRAAATAFAGVESGSVATAVKASGVIGGLLGGYAYVTQGDAVTTSGAPDGVTVFENRSENFSSMPAYLNYGTARNFCGDYKGNYSGVDHYYKLRVDAVVDKWSSPHGAYYEYCFKSGTAVQPSLTSVDVATCAAIGYQESVNELASALGSCSGGLSFDFSNPISKFLPISQDDTGDYYFDGDIRVPVAVTDFAQSAQDFFDTTGEYFDFLGTVWNSYEDSLRPGEYQGKTYDEALAIANDLAGTSHDSLEDFPALPTSLNPTGSTDYQDTTLNGSTVVSNPYSTITSTTPVTGTQTTTTTTTNADGTTSTTQGTTDITIELPEQLDYRGYLTSIINNSARTATNTNQTRLVAEQQLAELQDINQNLTEFNTDTTLAPTFEDSTQRLVDGLFNSPLITSLSAPQIVGGGVCPVYEIPFLFGAEIPLNLHCIILEENQAYWFSLMIALYSLLALFIFLRA
nr:hypothetical protein 9 [Piscirickettsiaceae bacterium]